MRWPPQIGEYLPRAEECWYEWSKVEGWILEAEGHGPEWNAVFHVGLDDWRLAWETIAEAAIGVTIQVIRDRFPFGVEVELTINGRRAPVTLSWHYDDEDSAPRLVTAYPSL